MRLAIVWSAPTVKDLDQPTREVVASLAASHQVEIWTDVDGVGRKAKRLPGASIREVTESELQQLIQTGDVDLLLVSTPERARLAINLLPTKVPLAYWSLSDTESVSKEALALATFVGSLDAVLVSSSTIRDDLLLRLGSRTVPVLSVTEDGLNMPDAPVTQAERLGVSAAGPLEQDAGFGDVVRAFKHSGAVDAGWHLTIGGEGVHRGPLLKLVERRGLEQSVSIDSTQDGLAVLSGASVFTTSGVASTHQTLALEAALRGIPTVGFEGDPYAEMIVRAGGGFFVPYGAYRALGAGLEYLTSHPDVLEAMGARARAAASAATEQALSSADPVPPWVAALEGIFARPTRRAPQDRVPTLPAVLSRTGLEVRDLLESSVRAALKDAAVPYASVELGPKTTDPHSTALVAGTEHIEATVDLLFEQLNSFSNRAIRVWVDGHAAHERPANTREDVPLFLSLANRIDVQVDTDEGPAELGIDFWHADKKGIRRPPRRNREADWVGPQSWQKWVEESAVSVTGLPLWDSITFPIDAVFTWVDDSDPQWRDRRAQYRDVGESDADGAVDKRFINRDEIYSSVAAARSHLPWLRRIIIVTDGQRHSAIQKDFPEVEFVDHEDIFPDTSALPVFNSHAIEAALHRIPGLAEHFLYFNDDVFVVRPLPAAAFFAANGVARFFPSSLKVNFHDDLTGEAHLLAAANNRRLIARDFGFEITHSMLHTPYPHMRSVLEEMDSRYAKDFDGTRRSRFRSGEDLSVLSSFAQYYGWATQRYQPSELEYRFVRLNAGGLKTRIKKVTDDPAVQVVCMGEPLPHQARHSDEESLVQDFLDWLATERK